MPIISGGGGGAFNGGTVGEPTNIIGNAGNAAMLYVEADDASQPFALEVGGAMAGDILIVIPDNVGPGAGHSRVIVQRGFVIAQANAAQADADLTGGDMSLWLDKTDGACKLMVKAKQADGTVRTGSVNLA